MLIEGVRRIRVAFVTNFPSHYNVDLFNALSQRQEIDLKVFYLRAITPGRQWKQLRRIEHPHQFAGVWFSQSGFYVNPGVVRSILRWQPDILVLTQYAAIAQQHLMYLWTLLRKPWIFWSEAPGVEFHEIGLVRNEVLRQILRNAAILPLRRFPSHIWAIGSRAQRAYQSLSKAKCVNVPYCFDQSAFRIIPLRETKVARPIKFLYVGKLVYRKGFDILLQAVAQLSQFRADFRLVIVGDGPHRELLRELSQEVGQYVDFRGFKELAEIPSLYAECDVFVFPTRYDGWGMVIPEAMAAGMAVISSRSCGSALDLISADNGLLYDAESVEELVSCMNFFLDNRSELVQMGASARRTVAAQSAENGAERMVELLYMALSK